MQGLKLTSAIAAIAAIALVALTAAAPIAANAADPSRDGGQKLRWDAIAAEGQRFQEQRQHQATPVQAAKARNFMAMAAAAREAR